MTKAGLRSWRPAPMPATPSGDPADQVSARLVAGIVDLLLVSVALFGAVRLVEPAPTGAATKITLASGLLVLYGLRRLVRSGRVRAAAAALCVFGWVAVATDLPVHGSQTIAAGGFVVLVVIGGLAVGPVAAIALAVATVALLAVVMLGLVPIAPADIPSGGVRLTHYATQLTLAAALVAWWAGHVRALLAQLRASEARQAQLLEGSPDAIVRVDTAGSVTFCNAAVERILGFAPGDLVGRRWDDIPIISPPQLEALRAKFLAAVGGGALPSVEVDLTHRDGHAVTVDAKGYPIQEEDGRVLGVVAILRDVSERKKAERERLLLQEQLVTAQRMEAVGRFAGGIAHDFNNILTVILNATDVVGHGSKADDDEALSDARDAATRGATLTRQLLTFSRRQPSQPRPTDLNRSIAGLRPMLERLLGEDVNVELEPDPDIQPVVVDPGQIDQVLVNLAVNARDAMPAGGTIRIVTRAIAGGAGRPPRVAVEVRDTGSGMDAATKAKAFDPFFTTKGELGTGLGLSVVQSIVQHAAGTIACESEPGAGTTFRIELPAVEGGEVAPAAGRASAALRVSRRIVLVDDDPMVRQTVARALQAAGVTVDVLAPPVDVASVEARVRLADVLVTDLVMPGLTGPDLVDALRKRGCDVPVIFVSGHAEHALVERARKEPRSTLLSKPFTPEDVLVRLDELIRPPR
jgi:two-component system cell cycle sensor histidine kinase/response regulator CckA